jgi:hypothetical protein
MCYTHLTVVLSKMEQLRGDINRNSFCNYLGINNLHTEATLSGVFPYDTETM